MSSAIFEITKAATFDAAHHLPAGPAGPYTRLHGHSFRVEATVRTTLQPKYGLRMRPHFQDGHAERSPARVLGNVIGVHAVLTESTTGNVLRPLRR